MRLDYAEPALADIENIYDTIANDRPKAAAQIVARLRSAAEIVREHPLAGRAGSIDGTREWVVSGLPYILVYMLDPSAEAVVVARVLHGARQRARRPEDT